MKPLGIRLPCTEENGAVCNLQPLRVGLRLSFPTVSFQVGPSPSPLTVNRGRGQRIGRVPPWQECCFLQLPIFCGCPPRFQCFSRYRLLLLAPFLRRRGSFCSQPAVVRSWMARLTVASDRPVSRETVGTDGKQVPSLLLRSRR